MRKRIPYDRMNLGGEEMLGAPTGAGDLLGAQGAMGGMPPMPQGDAMGLGGLDAMGGGGDLAGGAAPPLEEPPPLDAAAGGAVGPPVPDDAAFEEMAMQELMAALQDPSTPPEERELIQAQLAEAAKRRLGGG